MEIIHKSVSDMTRVVDMVGLLAYKLPERRPDIYVLF